MPKKKKLIVAPSVRGDAMNVQVSSLQDAGEKRTHSARNIARFSKLDIDWDIDAIKNSLTSSIANNGDVYNYAGGMEDYADLANFTSNNDYIAYFDKSYEQRRTFLRMFASDALIEQCVETIADETIIYDSNGYFANLDTKKLQSKLKDTDDGRAIIKGLHDAYKHVYYKFGFLNTVTAWEYMIKLLVDGILAFEIVFDYDQEKNLATGISSFKEVDPITLKPAVTETESGLIKYWIQTATPYDTDSDVLFDRYNTYNGKEVRIPDGHIIYISWASKTNFSKISYVERLVRSFNLLRQLENSRIIWNIQNAQSKVKITVPVGEQNEERIKTRLGMFRAMYKEDVSINALSGEVIYNGSPNFPFAKNLIIPSNSQGSIDVSEIPAGGYDLNSTEQLKYFWDRFIAETKIPRTRFSNTISQGSQSIPLGVDQSTANHEEYAFGRFLNRVRSVFKEILLKPTWIQFCLMYPQYANINMLKNYIGLEFNEENLFMLYKERQNLASGVSSIQSLAGLQDSDGTPYFSNRFLIYKFLGLSDDDVALNKKYKEQDKKRAEAEAEGEEQANSMNPSFGEDSFGGNDFGTPDFGGPDLGGPDLGGGFEPDTGATEAPEIEVPEPEAAPEPAPEA